MVPGYNLWRADRTEKGGGILAYLRSDIPGCRRVKCEFSHIGSIAIEVMLGKGKWLIFGVYRPPSMPISSFIHDLYSTLDRVSVQYDNQILTGELQYAES